MTQRKQWVWKKAGDRLINGNIMVWDCMDWNGVGELAEVEGRIDADHYVDILGTSYCPA